VSPNGIFGPWACWWAGQGTGNGCWRAAAVVVVVVGVTSFRAQLQVPQLPVVAVCRKMGVCGAMPKIHIFKKCGE